MKTRLLVFLLTLASALYLTPSGAQERGGEPLVMVEPPIEVLAHHLGLRSWAFVYNAYVNGHINANLSYYQRDEGGAWERTDSTIFGIESDPSGLQRITLVIGPDGDNVPFTLQINQAVYSSEISGFSLGNFNSSTPTIPKIVLQPSNGEGTFILLSHYPEVDGNVVHTGDLEDMDAYLALEVGQEEP